MGCHGTTQQRSCPVSLTPGNPEMPAGIPVSAALRAGAAGVSMVRYMECCHGTDCPEWEVKNGPGKGAQTRV